MIPFDVLTIGNAIVDFLVRVDDSLLMREGLIKGSMHLVDAQGIAHCIQTMPQDSIVRSGGGSAANTAVGLARLGSRVAFIGKVADDDIGHFFSKDLQKEHVYFPTKFLSEKEIPTASCAVFITSDGERTMNTYLGACLHLTETDIDQTLISNANIVYLEGYLWDPPEAKKAFLKASQIAHSYERKVALTLSDSFCVERWREEFIDLIQTKVIDIIFANKEEILSLYRTNRLESAIEQLQKSVNLSVVTLSEDGAVIITPTECLNIPAIPVENVVDLTGAGDQFAAGFLYGLSQGLDYRQAGHLAVHSASSIISQVGSRPSQL